jgi:Dyp-type peroxidase family
MPLDLETRKPHRRSDAPVQRMLAQTQGNILRGHGRDHAVYLFLRFTSEAEVIRGLLTQILPHVVTSAETQVKQSKQFSEFGIRGDLFCNFLLTANGYQKLGFDRAAMARIFPEDFRTGMKPWAKDLHDPPLDQWDTGYRGSIDALLLLANDDESNLEHMARRLIRDLTPIAELAAVEHGHVLRDSEERGIEHFGYVDGRSQPVFFEEDLKYEGSRDVWDPVEPLKLVLKPDPGVENMDDAFGSFYVFRKLEQNVAGFWEAEQELARALGLPPGQEERAGAMVVGRFRDGTPVELAGRSVPALAATNDFTYDPNRTSRCPLHAHIRKTNPRHDIGEAGRQHRIARRGIPYGKRSYPPPREDVGLLFSCFQSNITDQFLFLQQSWINHRHFLRQDTGTDPLISSRMQNEIGMQWPIEWGMPGDVRLKFEHFVTMKGGEFFFAPSIPFLARLECGKL